ncbi:MAG: alpha/beta hydrolase [Chloroflexota bacterium]|nr:MAG: alpha/beta hydrolase [Chloroflexota bacterium]
MSTTEIQHNFIDIKGIRTHYLSAGQADAPSTVVLLHGGGVDTARLSWELLIPELAGEHRVLAPDWPGFGESDRPDIDYTSEFYIQFLHDFLDALHIQRLSLAGISMGGAAALGFALRSPQRVDKLVLVDSYGLQRVAPAHFFSYLFIKIPGVNALTWAAMRNRAMARYTLGSLLRRPGAVTDELVDQLYQEILKPDGDRAWTRFQNSDITWRGVKTCFMDRLGEIQAPTLIVHGTKDVAVPVENAREAHARITGSKLVWMEGCGHWPQRDNPPEFNRVVREFLASKVAETAKEVEKPS